MEKALWISRHDPTLEQLTELFSDNVTLVALKEGKELGNRNLVTDEDVDNYMKDLHVLIRLEKAEGVYGVFPIPVQGRLVQDTSEIYARREAGWEDSIVSCFSAWNVWRSIEGQKPTFEHKKFVWVGELFNIPEN